jgi:hypothetical protein
VDRSSPCTAVPEPASTWIAPCSYGSLSAAGAGPPAQLRSCDEWLSYLLSPSYRRPIIAKDCT